jgi:ABC transporter, phosphonate, periplasmic substrate-binding protein
LCSQVSRRVIGGEIYDLKEFGGVIATLASRNDIRSIHDLKGKKVAAASISGLGSGQMQFLEMELAGMSWINDPAQLVFTSNQGKVVNGILKGEFDVGFVRTDQIEGTADADSNPIDASLLKIIDLKSNLYIDDVPFPFQSSTPLYPEWNVAALTHTPDIVATELQQAMLAIKTHAEVATYRLNETTSSSAIVAPSPPQLCDTTDEVAEKALNATASGGFSEWVPSLSYMELRSMQESTGFFQYQNNTWRCFRTEEIYDSISCPAGYLKKSELEVATGCADAGLTCSGGYQCICSPCYKPLNCIDSVSIAGQCVEYDVFLPALLVPIALLFVAVCFIALGFKSRQMVTQAKQSANNERDLNEFLA